MRGLGAAARQAARLAASSTRGVAAESGALAESSAFTRFTSPVPAAFSHAGILSAPPTKARAGGQQRRRAEVVGMCPPWPAHACAAAHARSGARTRR